MLCGLLRFSFCSARYRATQRAVNLFGCVRLHAGHDVAVEVEGNPDRRMPKASAGDLRVNAAGEELGGCAAGYGTDAGQGEPFWS